MPGYRKLIGRMVWVIAACSVAACGQSPVPGPDTALPGDDTFNPYQVRLDPLYEIRSAPTATPATAAELTVFSIPRDRIYTQAHEYVKIRGAEPTVSKISPVLEKWLAEMDDDEVVDIIVTFLEDLDIPRLPGPGADERREDANSRRAVVIDALKRQRAASQNRLLRQLQDLGRFEHLEGFWIVNSFVARLEIGEIKKLAEAGFVTYLQPRLGGEQPPSDPIPENDVENGRALIDSEPYYKLGLTTPGFGLLDTGVRESHLALAQPDVIGLARDCVNGGSTCDDLMAPGYDPGDFFWDHGTQTAAILSGGALLGMEYRGVSEVLIDSWQIYTGSGLDSSAVIRAIQAGIAAYDRVLVGELQANESETGAIATAADNAYDTGVVFISANGNFGPAAATVRSPAIAHKVIGVGGFEIVSGTQYQDQGRGPANDGRIKPDIQAPTESETASSAGDTALKKFTGTSGATPYAAAAAMLCSNWLQGFGTWDNGQTYAFMILYGQDRWPHDNTTGAGHLKMATGGWAWWGKVALGQDLNIDIPIDVAMDKSDLDAALWWPESAGQYHNDFDIYLIDPGGVIRAEARSLESVFERTGVSGALTPGIWTLRIRGEDVPAGTPVVYWAAHIRN